MDAHGNTSNRQILHIDMNAFYCACHAAAEPEKYAGRATAVAGSPETRHGVVVTASYEARKVGVRATMTVMEATRACKNLILIPPNFDLYRMYSRKVFELVRSYTPLLEIFSIDECWADITGSGQFGSAIEIATSIQSRLLAEVGLPCSIGVANNKFLAKMASDFKKPLGITTLWQDEVSTKLWPLQIDQMFGVGAKSADKLRRFGVETIGDLAAIAPERLTRSFGKRGLDLVRHANGIDDAPVISEPEPTKSVGHSITLSTDAGDLDTLNTVLMNLSDQVGRRLRRHRMYGRTVQLTIRYANRETITRAKTLSVSTHLTDVIYQTACDLLVKHKDRHRTVRLLGVTVSHLSDSPSTKQPIQLSLFDNPHDAPNDSTNTQASEQKREQLTKVTDLLRDKYGEDIVVRGRMLQAHESRELRDHKARGTSLQRDRLE